MEASDQNDGAGSPNLAPDQATMQGPIDTSDTVALRGFLGAASLDEYCRLYESAALNRYIDVPAEDIVARVPADGGGDVTVGESIIRVRRDANLLSCELVRASIYEGPPDSDGDPPRAWPRP